MYEKLCAILDALRKRGISCKAECLRLTGQWEIVFSVPCDYGTKLFRFPVSHNLLDRAEPDYLISYVISEVYK